MGQQVGVIKDTTTGLYCTSYSTTLGLCTWGNSNDAVEFPTVADAQTAATDMNTQYGSDRFIGQNPPPR